MSYFKVSEDFLKIKFVTLNDYKVICDIARAKTNNLYSVGVDLKIQIDELEKIIGRLFILNLLVRDREGYIISNSDFISYVKE